ncbi:putative radial spokehead-l [Schistosoma mansoni]|uniref:putative radial spokehead-l n=1 Tax=Schistosoma mansoni TaxID=6183 RepID=UPI00022DC297|nr:putative radial spokehead-l [Schistosoma mansoni]|eukprot:XP_018650162.1 putative radial spokehead-l [Schistosoma mansoni]
MSVHKLISNLSYQNIFSYDHLVQVLCSILKGNRDNSLVELENLSREIKRFKCSADLHLIRRVKEVSADLDLALRRRSYFTVPSKEVRVSEVLPDLSKLFFALGQAGIGFPQEEVVNLSLSIRSFLTKNSPTFIRFWGKYLGTSRNYYVLEVEELGAGDKNIYPPDAHSNLRDNESTARSDVELSERLAILDMDPLPKSEWKPQPPVPPEEHGKGTNRKTYFVCNVLGDDWVRLPDVTPEQIVTSRMIKYFCTGDLEAEINTFPTFPGVEKNFLRAQIARISGSTTISPINYYQFNEDEEEEQTEEDALRENFIENPEYEPMTIYDLTDPTLTNWVHHTAYILPQGRTVWLNTAIKTKDELEDEMSEDEEEEPDEPEPETGPPLLTPLSEDAEIGGIPPWSTRITSQLIPHYAYAVLSSNIWPGAYALAQGRFFANIYVGWGLKYTGMTFSPQIIPKPFEEFPSGLEITEVDDPTPEEEAAWRAAQAEAAQHLEDENKSNSSGLI